MPIGSMLGARSQARPIHGCKRPPSWRELALKSKRTCQADAFLLATLHRADNADVEARDVGAARDSRGLRC